MIMRARIYYGKIEYAIEQHPSFLKVIPEEVLKAKEKLNVTRQWDFNKIYMQDLYKIC